MADEPARRLGLGCRMLVMFMSLLEDGFEVTERCCPAMPGGRSVRSPTGEPGERIAEAFINFESGRGEVNP
jgi:hypothetical protein